jgi:hypothetical protein
MQLMNVTITAFIAAVLMLPVQAQSTGTITITITVPASHLQNLKAAIAEEHDELKRRNPTHVAPSVEDFIASNVASFLSRMVLSFKPDLAPKKPDEAQAAWMNRYLAQYKSAVTVVIK